MITFKGYNPYIQQFRTDRGWRVSFDVSQDQYDAIKDIPKLLDNGIYNIIVTEEKETLPKETRKNRYARYYALLGEMSKINGIDIDQLNDKIKAQHNIKSKSELDDKQLNSLIYDIEVELGYTPPDENYNNI